MDRAPEDGEHDEMDRAPEDGERLFDLLTGDGRRLVPVYYRLFERRPPRSGVPQRVASSAWYQAPSFSSFPFHKPISRCRRYDKP